MKPIVSFVLAVFCVYSSAAPVEWGIIEGGGSTTDGVWVGQYLPKDVTPYEILQGLYVYPNINLTAAKNGKMGVIITADPEMIVTAYGDNWVQVEEGGLVDASTTRNQDHYFFHGWLDDGADETYTPRADDPITAAYNSTFDFYLGFATAAEYAGSWNDPWKYVYYGWAQFTYSNGTITLVDSALNTEGGGIYAGTGITTPVPEPATGLLSFLGILLLLRPRKDSASVR